jgi:hypothetical protein
MTGSAGRKSVENEQLFPAAGDNTGKSINRNQAGRERAAKSGAAGRQPAIVRSTRSCRKETHNVSILIDQSRLSAVCASLFDGHVAYCYGAKASLTADPATIQQIDCSGFVRYLTYQATNGQIVLPDGSWNQHRWCKSRKLSKVAYSTAAKRDGWLRIAFIESTASHAGHVWLVLNGMTLESDGSKGPDQRPWNYSILRKEVGACYLFARTYMLLFPIQPPRLASIL